MKIEYDEQLNIIRVGKAEFAGYTRWQNSAAWANYVLEKNDAGVRLNTYTKNRQAENKQAADALGCSRATLYKHFNKLQLKVFVAPVYNILKKVAFSRSGFSQTALRKINKNLNVVKQVYEDGLYNILPVVVESEESPQQLKKELKGVWKTIANNSLNKNKALAQAARGYHDLIRMQKIAGLPTTVLKNFKQSSPEEMIYITEHFKGKWNKPSEVNRHLNLLRDTVYMARQLAQDVNPKWSPRRLKEEHDRMAREITARKYSKDQFESTKGISVKSLKCGEYVATLLESAFDIAEEGNVMGHCVAGYTDQVRQGDYLVYSVTKGGEKVSTIGVVKGGGYSYHNQRTGKIHNDPADWRLQQHYGRFNALVKDEDEKSLGQTIAGLLNKKLDNSEKQA